MALVDSLAADAANVANISTRPARDSVNGSTRGEIRGTGQRPALSVAGASPRTDSVSPRDAVAHEGKRKVWRVQCGDLISRERCVTVFVDNNEVVLVGPPGETARLTGGQLGQLRAALNEAAKLAER